MAGRNTKHINAQRGGGLVAFLSGCFVIALGISGVVLQENGRLAFSTSGGLQVVSTATAAEAPVYN